MTNIQETQAQDSVEYHSLIDSHCHLDFTDFDRDRGTVLADCAEKNIAAIIVPATEQAHWQRTLACCANNQTHVKLLPALGLHPVMIDAHQPHHLVELETLATAAEPIAIGEIGLDFHKHLGHSSAQREKQRLYFEKQLRIAHRLDLPVIIHNRKAHDECLALLNAFAARAEPIKGGIIHAFSGSIAQAQKYSELGFYLGFGGMLTYARSAKLHALVQAISLEHIVIETDAPDMVVAQHRGQRNSPAYLDLIAAAVAKQKQVSLAAVAKATSANINTLFKLTDK